MIGVMLLVKLECLLLLVSEMFLIKMSFTFATTNLCFHLQACQVKCATS
jgi:hypothetical protein